MQFHGRVDGADLRELYRNADVFVLPSEREGMPLVLLEALAMGLPIVATDVPGNRELVSSGQNGLLVPLGDAAALRQALLSITTDPERYRRMSETSRRLADRYSWWAVSAEFEQIYTQVGGERREEPTGLMPADAATSLTLTLACGSPHRPTSSRHQR